MTFMRKKTTVMIGLVLASGLVFNSGCGGDFLGLEDYQRDLLIGGLAVGLLLDQQADDGGDAGTGQPLPSPEGPEGPRGLPGADGAAGAEGPAGPEGPEGPEGPAGPTGPEGPEGPAGLACWDLNENGEADLDSEDSNGDGVVDIDDCVGADGPAGANGSPGAPGAPGPMGPEFFDIFIDDFFTEAVYPNGFGTLPVELVDVEEPSLQYLGDALGYRVAVPEIYDSGNDVTMRLFFHRTEESDWPCFVFRLDARRLIPGENIDTYGDPLWILIESLMPEPLTPSNDGLTLVIDLPLGILGDVDPALSARDFLAFELTTVLEDYREYHLVGVEFFEGYPGTAVTSGATVLTEEPVDCPGGD